VDIVPGFGTSSSLADMAHTMLFNFVCLFGGDGCSSSIITLAWANFITTVVASVAFCYVMRYSTEGANFVIVFMALRTPLALLFWTLFVEDPFAWEPHIHLSTWLSIGSMFIMIPAIIIYNKQSSLATNEVNGHIINTADYRPLSDDNDNDDPGVSDEDNERIERN